MTRVDQRHIGRRRDRTGSGARDRGAQRVGEVVCQLEHRRHRGVRMPEPYGLGMRNLWRQSRQRARVGSVKEAVDVLLTFRIARRYRPVGMMMGVGLAKGCGVLEAMHLAQVVHRRMQQYRGTREPQDGNRQKYLHARGQPVHSHARDLCRKPNHSRWGLAGPTHGPCEGKGDGLHEL